MKCKENSVTKSAINSRSAVLSHPCIFYTYKVSKCTKQFFGGYQIIKCQQIKSMLLRTCEDAIHLFLTSQHNRECPKLSI